MMKGVDMTSSGSLYPDVVVAEPQQMQAVAVAQAVPVDAAVPVVGHMVSGEPLAQAVDHLPPSGAPSVPQSEALQTLSGRGFPRGLASEVVDSTRHFPIRLWIVDNSGSMQSTDGSRLVQAGGGAMRMIQSTRWQELSDTLAAVGEMACNLGARTDFLMLNRPPSGQPQFTTVGGDRHAHDGGAASMVPVLGPQLDAVQLRQMMASLQPSGGTPLTEAVMQCISLLEPAVPSLTASGQQAVVVLATDGVPNDPHSFVQALQHLQRLPVWLVVRLCTNDDNVVQYWSDLDRSLEAPLEVLDDEKGEAEEINALNPWLTYGPPLHLAREFGLKHRLFDLLDERKLMPSQVRELCELLLGCGQLPEPELEWSAFLSALRSAVNAAPSTVDPRSGRRRPWIDLGRIGSIRPGAVGCPCM